MPFGNESVENICTSCMMPLAFFSDQLSMRLDSGFLLSPAICSVCLRIVNYNTCWLVYLDKYVMLFLLGSGRGIIANRQVLCQTTCKLARPGFMLIFV